MKNLILTVYFTLVASHGLASPSRRCVSDADFFVSDDCRQKWQCSSGNLIEMPQCVDVLVFSKSGECVWKGSQEDDCSAATSKDDADMTIEEKCAKSKALLIPHPDECQLYYNCSRPFDKVDPYFEPFLEECEHPKLFDNVTKMCTDYKNVKCGNRIERKWVCDYRKSQCPVSHCRPCWVDNPSCIGLEDGIHADPRGPSFYMHCKDERAVGKGQCVDKETGQPLKLIQGKCQ